MLSVPFELLLYSCCTGVVHVLYRPRADSQYARTALAQVETASTGVLSVTPGCPFSPVRMALTLGPLSVVGPPLPGEEW